MTKINWKIILLVGLACLVFLHFRRVLISNKRINSNLKRIDVGMSIKEIKDIMGDPITESMVYVNKGEICDCLLIEYRNIDGASDNIKIFIQEEKVKRINYGL